MRRGSLGSPPARAAPRPPGARRGWNPIEDIAHHLSLLCRFGGSTRRLYSVAEHCCLGAEFVAPEHKLAFLLHDAPEYLLGDVISPIKFAAEMHLYRSVERHVWGIIADRFGVPRKLPKEVHEVDMRLRVTEMRDLMGRAPQPKDEVVPLPMLIRPEPCWNAEQMFLDAFERYSK